jgi:cytoskeletal protein CcmA (bactofilin family)
MAETPKIVDRRSDIASIGKSVVIKGELSGSEDLYLDGEVEGSIVLNGNSLTVGPNGRVRAHIKAREVIVHGKVDGNILSAQRVELRRSAAVLGDISSQRIMIEDGAYVKGSIDVQRDANSAPPQASVPASQAAEVTK